MESIAVKLKKFLKFKKRKDDKPAHVFGKIQQGNGRVFISHTTDEDEFRKEMSRRDAI